MKKKLIITLILLVLTLTLTLTLTACSTDADVVSHNLSKDADQFKVQRRIIFFNGITDTYLMTIEGKCSIQPDVDENQLEVTCKIEEDTYKKHYLGLSDNVSYFVEQTDAIKSDPYHYKVIFKPQTIIPDIDLKTSN